MAIKFIRTKELFNLPLVNAHAHSAMVAFRGLAEDMPLDKWLNDYIWPMERDKVTPKFVYNETKKAIREMRQNGISVFCDMYFFEEEVARAALELKMKAVIGEAILDFPTPSAKTPAEALAKTEALLKKYRKNHYISVSVAPHSIYTVSRENLLKAKDLARKYNVLYQIHLAETKKEFDDCMAQNNLTPVGYLDKLKILDANTLLHHCVWLTDEDIKILAKRGTKVVHCPLSNLKLGSGIAPIAKLLKVGVTVALGTDGAASSNRLDIWEAGKIAALLQKGINLDPTQISAKQAVEMMTINGLKALGFKFFNNRPISYFGRQFQKTPNYNFLYEI